MNAKLRVITAWIALFFMVVASVTLIAHMTNQELFDGKLVWLVVFSYAVGLSLFAVIKLSDAQKKHMDNDQ